MLIPVLVALGFVSALCAVAIVFVQHYKIKKGAIVVDETYNGPEQVSVTVRAVIRFFLKRSVHMRKFCMQYVFHVMVRVMYYFDIITRKMYEKSRNWFVKNAVKNKGTVPHFWEHLKVYKQEMDKEREEEEMK
ncbi:MAG: hypothetical protein RLZZ308_368 [Candidatus Parcubacteria bacterium]|jgi:hypothetical protein